MYERKSPAVVMISALTINPYRMEERVLEALGSGFIFDASGLVMTNSHVVFGAQIVTVTIDDGTILPAKVLGADPIYDLAILQIPKPDKGRIPTLSFGDSDRLRPGDDVIAIGNPLGLDQTVTRGIISGLNRILPERPFLLSHKMIQTDTAINPGNSGGPLLNRCGEVVGINSQIISGAQSIGFAIPSNLAKSAIPQLVEKGRVVRPWLGFDGQILEPELRQIFNLPPGNGLLVEAVEPGSPADLAGIQGGRTPIRMGLRSFILGGDMVLSINGISLADPKNIDRVFDTIRIGAKIKLKLLRQGKTSEVDLNISERPLQPGDVPESSQAFSVKEAPGGGKR
jgi:S1-C subfamily serine protease